MTTHEGLVAISLAFVAIWIYILGRDLWCYYKKHGKIGDAEDAECIMWNAVRMIFSLLVMVAGLSLALLGVWG